LSSSPSPFDSHHLDPDRLPRHVAVIMDGNGRWAKQRIMNRVKGHERGTETVRTIVRANRALNIPVLTLYAFSTENWQRSKAEVTALMAILDRFLKSERKEMMENDIRLNAIGQVDRLPNFVQKALEETMQATAQNRSMTLNLALSYGARNEIVRMVRAIAEKSISGDIAPEAITEQLVSEHLYTADFPDPDLLIRTSGEMRISNFLLWQIAYSEIFVTKTLWPDFSKEEYHKILKEYQQRDRRFGIA
jgi:undecaprenyl diphosphate synthase